MDVKEPISIFTSAYQTADFIKSMGDLASLAVNVYSLIWEFLAQVISPPYCLQRQSVRGVEPYILIIVFIDKLEFVEK